MKKETGYRAVIDVDGFHDAKRWIYDMIRAGIVKCGQCSEPATHVFWQDRAEWYCRCDQHREYGDQWTGSTRWNPTSFDINVRLAAALLWRNHLEPDERAKVRIIKYDATDYYALMSDDWSLKTEHYFVGSNKEYGWSIRAVITPLTNGEYVYELHRDYMTEHSGTMHAYGVRGAWESEALALDAAKAEALKRKWLPE